MNPKVIPGLSGLGFSRVALGVFAVQFLPYLFLGEWAYVRIHDTLEGELVWYALLAENGLLLDFSPNAVVPQVMNGLNRSAFHSGLSGVAFWVAWLGPYWGYLANLVLLHLLAFTGMYRLLGQHFLPLPQYRFAVSVAAACFAWVPFFPVFGATVAGQPWALWAWLCLLQGRGRWFHAVVLLALPFYTSLVWAAPALMLLLGGTWLYRVLAYRTWPLRPLLLLPPLAGLYLVANMPLLNLFLGKLDFVSHRKEYDFFYDHQLSFVGSLTESAATFFSAHYHVGTFICVPILAGWLLARRGVRDRLAKIADGIVLGIAGLSLFYGFYSYVAYALGDIVPLVLEFRFNRVIVLLPFLWCLVLAFVLARLNGQRALVGWTAGLVAAAQLAIALPANDSFVQNVRQLAGAPRKPNYNAFVADDLFEKIDAHIGKPKQSYRVACLGLNPTVAQLNGFYTLDGLQALYDLRYKHRFRAIMADELAQSDTLRNYFDHWGNRCYLFSTELGIRDRHFLISKFQQPKAIQHWAFNVEAFAELGGAYLFSTVEIKNAADIGLLPDGVFETEKGWWRIYLYKARTAN